MKLEMWRDPINLDKHFHLVITDKDMVDAYPYLRLDSTLLHECEKSEKISDKLIGIERLVFRIEQVKVAE